MTDEFEQRAREEARRLKSLSINIGIDRDVPFAKETFIAGAKWARAEMSKQHERHMHRDVAKQEEIERLKGELREVNAMYVAQARELEQAKDEFNTEYSEAMDAIAGWNREVERLSLLAENDRSKFLKFLDYAEGAWGRCHTGEFFGAIREARQSLSKDGK